MKKRQAKTLYKKVGNKFVAVGTDDFILPYGVGDYLVRVRKYGKSIRWCKKRLDVNHARIEIALDEATDAIAKSISEVSKLEPQRLWTKREMRAWKEYKRIAGKESLTFSGKSTYDMARMAVVVLRENLKTYDTKERPEGCIDVFAEKNLGH